MLSGDLSGNEQEIFLNHLRLLKQPIKQKREIGKFIRAPNGNRNRQITR
jgi:hypothetical protein